MPITIADVRACGRARHAATRRRRRGEVDADVGVAGAAELGADRHARLAEPRATSARVLPERGVSRPLDGRRQLRAPASAEIARMIMRPILPAAPGTRDRVTRRRAPSLLSWMSPHRRASRRAASRVRAPPRSGTAAGGSRRPIRPIIASAAFDRHRVGLDEQRLAQRQRLVVQLARAFVQSPAAAASHIADMPRAPRC